VLLPNSGLVLFEFTQLSCSLQSPDCSVYLLDSNQSIQRVVTALRLQRVESSFIFKISLQSVRFDVFVFPQLQPVPSSDRHLWLQRLTERENKPRSKEYSLRCDCNNKPVLELKDELKRCSSSRSRKSRRMTCWDIVVQVEVCSFLTSTQGHSHTYRHYYVFSHSIGSTPARSTYLDIIAAWRVKHKREVVAVCEAFPT